MCCSHSCMQYQALPRPAAMQARGGCYFIPAAQCMRFHGLGQWQCQMSRLQQRCCHSSHSSSSSSKPASGGLALLSTCSHPQSCSSSLQLHCSWQRSSNNRLCGKFRQHSRHLHVAGSKPGQARLITPATMQATDRGPSKEGISLLAGSSSSSSSGHTSSRGTVAISQTS